MKSQKFRISRIINAPAEVVWKVVGERYGEIQKYHTEIVESYYAKGFTSGGEGVERISYLNENKTKVAFEKQVDFNPENFSFTSQVIEFKGAAMHPEGTYMKYKVEPINETSCRLSGDMSFCTKPAFLGWIFKNALKNISNKHFIAIEHFAITNEAVNKQNRNSILKKYN